MILTHKWAREAIKKRAFKENVNFQFFDLTLKLYAFDLNTYNGNLNGVNGGCGVVP